LILDWIRNMSSNNTEDNKGGEGEMTSSKKECTSCDQNSFDTITKGISNIAILVDMSTCANCGKESNSNDMNTCNKCKEVKYCNAACKKKHRTKHKKACERRAAELHDEALFKESPHLREECPICLLPLPIDNGQSAFHSCCGKSICNGCIHAMIRSEGGADICAFCRTPQATSHEEHIERTKKLVDKGNGDAFEHLGWYYSEGIGGLPQDYEKANELYLKAGELGCANGFFSLGKSYSLGIRGIESDVKKARHYFEFAAIGGQVNARYHLGCTEVEAGNHHRAMKHFIIAARAGYEKSFEIVKKGFMAGLMTKDEYASTLRAYHERHKEMKSDDRDKAAVHYAHMTMSWIRADLGQGR